MIGGDGDDTLTGGSDRDIAIGGNGADRVVGNPGRDLISGGLLLNTESNDADTVRDELALAAMLTKFANATDEEIDAWRDETEDFFAGLGLEIVDDGDDADVLTGSSADDWFVAYGDSVTDLASNGKGKGGVKNSNKP